MDERPNVVVVLARCSQNGQPFGMRYEEMRPNVWVADWAFAIREDAAAREGYDRTEIRGEFGFAPKFPGCPHCGSKTLFRCSCGKVACWNGETGTITCPWCRASGQVTRGQVDSLSAGGDV